ncbi:MAG: DUF3536 domain-containing protein [Acidobacteriaceae bacterium]|nr:DUF3536 domain-containing protein [Acidobacteriaceae bacterium]
MALAYALDHIERNQLAKLTNYAEFLVAHPPQTEVRLHPSAVQVSRSEPRLHRSKFVPALDTQAEDCDWPDVLCEAFDWLRDSVKTPFETMASTLLKDPWVARDVYASLVSTGSAESNKAFADAHFLRELTVQEEVTVRLLMELQRHALLMYISDWFSGPSSGGALQLLKHSARVITPYASAQALRDLAIKARLDITSSLGPSAKSSPSCDSSGCQAVLDIPANRLNVRRISNPAR